MFSYFITHSTFRDGIVKKEMIYCFRNSYNCSTQKNFKAKTKKKQRDLFEARALDNYGVARLFDIQKLINFENVILHVRVCIAQSIINNRI